ncbi:rab effector MyRIP isoform X1 [Paramormyrops kingsleyae]|uniref:rab effector MyRIP isoform X1 n=1 Tax=Paramormyrops kingsleyae TaxID=1676925 RepID=UPI003B9726C2
MMGRKLDLSGLTHKEAEHVLQVVKRDMMLRKKEEKRLRELRRELAEEGSRCLLLSRQEQFNQRCCMRCCSPFTFLLNRKRLCDDCGYNVCRSCGSYSAEERAWICTACHKARALRTQSLEWYYSSVKSRFKRFGSAKVLKTLYRKHVVDRGVLSELLDGSIRASSFDDASTCASDSTSCRHSREHSMAETLGVALRVAEEAVEEAIVKAEEFSDSLEKQNEACYLRDNKEELIEELATTIVQKIIRRRKQSGMQVEQGPLWPLATGGGPPSPPPCQQSPPAPQASQKISCSLWRSKSACSLISDELQAKPTGHTQLASPPSGEARGGVTQYSSLRRDSRASPMTAWKSVDRLDNSSPSSMLQSPDGNWIALQNSQLGRPSLLTKRKSLVFSALEKESGVASAYDDMGSDSETGHDQADWVTALQEFRRRLSDETYYTDSQHDPEWTYSRRPPVTSPSSGRYTNTETLNSDSETSSTPPGHEAPSRHRASLLGNLKKKPPDPQHHPQQEALDVNLNPRAAGGLGPVDSSEAEDRQGDPVRKARRRKRSRREATEPTFRNPPVQYSSTASDCSGFLPSILCRRSTGQDGPTAASQPTTVTSDAMATIPSSLSHDITSGSPSAPLETKWKSKPCVPVSCGEDKKSSSSEEDLLARDARAGGRSQKSDEGGQDHKEKSEKVEEWKEDRLQERVAVKVDERQKEEAISVSREKGASEKKRSVERASKAGKEPGELVNSKTPEESTPFCSEDQPSAEDSLKERQDSLDLQQRLHFLSSVLQQKYSAASLTSITTEVLKVLNSTEELIEEVAGEGPAPSPAPTTPDSQWLGEHLAKLEENVYLAAGTVYGLEGELGSLEDCARAIQTATSERELAHLEEQVASAAAQVQQSEMRVTDIETRISALKNAGLNVVPCDRFSRFKPKPETISSSRQLRRKLPAPPTKDQSGFPELRSRAPWL